MEIMPTASDPRIAIPIKGRGTSVRIAHRFERDVREAVDDGWEAPAEDGTAPPPATTVTEERVKSILARNISPDVPFDVSINPYRGCEHGCIYCYARPTHGYLNLSPGLDFETRLVAKVNAAEQLRIELGPATGRARSTSAPLPTPTNPSSADCASRAACWRC